MIPATCQPRHITRECSGESCAWRSFATGDELKASGETLGEGDIYESNLTSIAAVLRHYPVELINFGVVEDTPEAIKACLAQSQQ